MRSPSFMAVAYGAVALAGLVLMSRPRPEAQPDQTAGRRPGTLTTAAAHPAQPPAGQPLAGQSPAPVAQQPTRAAPAGAAAAAEQVAASWKVPDPDTLPQDAYGKTVRYGRDLMTRTSSLIGPDAHDPAMRFAGSGITCQSCHLQAGTQQFGLPLAGIWGVFPTYIGRENNVRTLEDRINGCMERSMSGRALPPDGPEMKALVTYVAFISGGEQVGKQVPGRSTPALPMPSKAADPVHGREVFQTVCAACHGANGQGTRLDEADAAEQGKRYQFPPLWGPDSYNDGAGMARTITAAQFVHANMPYGTTWQAPQLSAEDAFDVMAFVNTQPRPHKADLAADYPDRSKKPVDAGYAPFVGPFDADQHRFGPWKPIQDWLKANPAAARDTP